MGPDPHPIRFLYPEGGCAHPVDLLVSSCCLQDVHNGMAFSLVNHVPCERLGGERQGDLFGFLLAEGL